MTARVLVVDDILANVRLLEAKLTAEYFDVVTAMNGLDALESINRAKPDIVLLDVMMPGIDGIEVCHRIKSDPATEHIPVIMVTALDQPEDRVRGLEAGADDFLTKPVNDVALFCRVKSLVRLKMLTDELRARTGTGEEVILSGMRASTIDADAPGRILLVDNRGVLYDRIVNNFGAQYQIDCQSDPSEVANHAARGDFELLIINLDFRDFDGLRLCSQLRSMESTRQIPILIIVDPDDNSRMMRALDMGVNDYLVRPIDRQELLARVNTQIRRWRYAQKLRTNVQQSLEMAVVDPLTGLYNRRYMQSQVANLVSNAVNRGKALSVLTLDIDFFKKVNDEHGHDAGDKVLQEFANRFKGTIRNVDLACRVGGEEFVAVLPDTDGHGAGMIAERLRKKIAASPFDAGSKVGKLPITVSIGVASLDGPDDTFEQMFKRSDDALYKAKHDGRNRVESFAA